ncbi:transposase [Sporosarcina obsidiansis]|uniref:transposase n=1 Tax=Sporosarcina obsidiansis TaxID=2660748 RepID=UPI0038B58E52
MVRSSYQPKIMLKVDPLSLLTKSYSCRGIEKQLNKSLPAMWLAAQQKPDFHHNN